MTMPKLCFVLGTRPEVIKLAPLIKLMCKKSVFKVVVSSTGQHKEMLEQTLDAFDLNIDINLDLMNTNQTLSGFTSRALIAIDRAFNEINPNVIIVQGDTTTTFVASLVAFYMKIPIAHVEAGLRTQDKFSPFPEEINRKMTTALADWHFAPTETSKKALLREGIDDDKIWVTGNTVVDAIDYIKKTSMNMPKEKYSDLPAPIVESMFLDSNSKLILITSHRRENFGSGLSNICEAIRQLALEYPQYNFVFPVHFNPNVRRQVFGILTEIKNIFLINPLDYKRFVRLMSSAEIILTDSGGIQEEVFSLSVPAFVMRENTERGEGLNEDGNNLVKLIGTERDLIVESVGKHLRQSTKKVKLTCNPYGDGLASQRINDIIETKMISKL